MLVNLNPTGDGQPVGMTLYQGEVYFAANNGITGEEIYKTDGTPGGTKLVVNIAPGTNSIPSGFLVANGLLYFSATDGISGRELWQSDGTAAGTQQVADLTPGAAGSSPIGLFNLKGSILFVATTPETGALELWAVPRPLSVEVVGGNLVIVENEHWGDDNDLSIAFDAVTQEIIVGVAAGPFVGLSGTTTSTGAVRIPLAAFAAGVISVDLGGGGDRLSLDISGGLASIAGGMTFNGGSGSNQLIVVGSQAEQIEFTSTAADAAELAIAAGAATLDLASISIDQVNLSLLQRLTLSTTGGADNMHLAVTKLGAAPAIGSLTGVSGSSAITPLMFSLIGMLDLDLSGSDTTGAEDDLLTITQAGLAALDLKELAISTGTGSDVIVAAAAGFNVDESLSISAQQITFPNGLALSSAMTVDVAGNVLGEVIGGGLVTITPAGAASLGAAGSFRGFDFAGELAIGGETLILNSAGLAKLGALTTLSAGTLTAVNGIALGDGDVIAGSGVVAGRLAAATGSSIIATGSLQLGDLTSPAGIASDGELHIGAHTATLLDANEAVLGSFTTIGTASADGALAAANGYLLGEGKNFSGRGAVGGAFHNDGHVISTGTIVFADLVTGIGDFAGNVTFNGGMSPGHSPASIDLAGDFTLGAGNALSIELGGRQPGNEYDRLQATGTANLGGSLAVSLINGFTPQAGDAFDILTGAAGVSGLFTSETLPALAEGLEWSIAYGANAVTLSVVESGLAADFDANGRVDGHDFLAWQRGLGASSATKLDGDADNDNDVDGADLGVWMTQFGSEAALAASSAAAGTSMRGSALPAGAWLSAPTEQAGAPAGVLAAANIVEEVLVTTESGFDAFAFGSLSIRDAELSFESFDSSGSDSDGDEATDDAFAGWTGLSSAL
jgi:ELWxxDGT repeat protein